MRNDASVWGDTMGLKIFTKGLFDKWKFLESKFTTMFSVPLILWDCRNTSLMMRVQNNQQDNLF